jgi:hypothetical protein
MLIQFKALYNQEKSIAEASAERWRMPNRATIDVNNGQANTFMVELV